MPINNSDPSYSSENFRPMVLGKFPELRSKLEKIDFIHSEAAEFGRYINGCIQCADYTKVSEALKLVDQLYRKGDSTIRSALQCDFFEVLDLRGSSGVKIFRELATELQEVYIAAQAYIGTPYSPDES